MGNLLASSNSTGTERRRVLVVAADAARSPYLILRTLAASRPWDVLEADGFERARFLLQMDHCDVLLLDGGLYQPHDESLPWLLSHHPLPTLLVAEPKVAVAGLRQGASHWLARDVALREPPLLSETLYQLAQVGDWQRRARVAGESLQESRRQVSRLVSLLWEVTPTDGGARWFTQRHMMERLYQEVARCDRHGSKLSVVLGEMRSRARSRLAPEEAHELATWTAERVTGAKRRCDVAGQYGPHGFMLLLPESTNDGAVVCCKRIQALLESTAAPVPQLQVYFGIASYSSASATAKALLGLAEKRLEEARNGNGERVVA